MMSKWVTTSSGLNVCEVHGTRRERQQATAYECEVQLRCLWEDRFKVMWDIYQNNVPYIDVPDALISSFAVEPVRSKPAPLTTGEEDVITYTEALITCYYSTEEIDADNLYIELLEPSAQGMIMAPENFQWGASGDPNSRSIEPREAPSRIIHQWTYTVHWIQQEKIPDDFFEYAGYVNNAEYTITKWNRICAAETMLFTPGPSGRSIWLDLAATTPEEKIPQAGWDYTCKFQINKYSWNKFYRAMQPGATSEEDRWVEMYLRQPNGNAIVFKPYRPISMVPNLLPPPPPPLRRSEPRG